ncbi:MAG: Zn finger domain-containing DnaJ-class molecular chaperone [Acidobacteria bacterium OLB17]|nr:MAG: Zn finger domain-containing DnaJ-class molecular chaperone [Acidobacteria bacterium OLB17]MCZ2389479.1 J domain-containing protein [Acidobacteriota bacterium]
MRALTLSQSHKMANYYEVLRVAQDATGAEIKSAYRRLARKLHPDKNNGAEDTARRFAEIAEAYEILGNPKQRAQYDRRILDAQFRGNGHSVFTSTNKHANRWRQMVYERRYNDILNRMIAEERREALAFQKVVYPLSAFLVSTVIAAAARPHIFASSEILGKILIVTLFAIGVIHLVGRVRDGFVRYTSYDDNIHDSILDDRDRKTPVRSRYAVAAALLGSIVAAFLVGWLAGIFLTFPADLAPQAFGRELSPEFIFYPPIITFFVDLMHSLAARVERRAADVDNTGLFR